MCAAGRAATKHLVQFVDAAAIAYAATPTDAAAVRRAPPAARWGLMLVCTLVPALAIAVIARAPGCLPPGMLPRCVVVPDCDSGHQPVLVGRSWCP